MITAICALLHFFVDLTCAWAMFGSFGGNYEYFLVYNFCAFALQMPLGTLMDLLRSKHPRAPSVCAAAGAALTVAGALLHPAVLGLGNALFHVGGGMDVIESDFACARKGRELGIFVAPGALGLYVGTLLGKRHGAAVILAVVSLLMLLLYLGLFRQKLPVRPQQGEFQSKGTFLLCAACFLVVILRSWVGMSVAFSWKAVPALAAVSVCAAAIGKLSGGLLAARFGIVRTVTASLLLAAICYLLGDVPIFGLLAILFFNMTMPITLYLLVQRLSRLPGFAFGLLTFGLFLGFLPVYARVEPPMPGHIFGAVGSLMSLLLLIMAGKAAEYGKIPA